MNYEVVRDLVPTLWDGDSSSPPQRRKIDFAVHIGMAGPQAVYNLERLGHRDGYRLKDVDGNLLGDEERREREGEDWVWHDVPSELTTELDIEEIYKNWVERSPVSRPPPSTFPSPLSPFRYIPACLPICSYN